MGFFPPLFLRIKGGVIKETRFEDLNDIKMVMTTSHKRSVMGRLAIYSKYSLWADTSFQCTLKVIQKHSFRSLVIYYCDATTHELSKW